MIRKSIFAALLIAIGVYVLMAAPAPIGTFLFAFGLMTICYYNGYLYTGKCGYVRQNDEVVQLLGILVINLIAGWIFGFIISLIDPRAFDFAKIRIDGWTNLLAHTGQAVFCGIIMFLAVDIKKRHNSVLGIIYGIPLFIFCGFQHSIANVIVCGMGHTLHIALLLAIVGNWCGALLASLLTE